MLLQHDWRCAQTGHYYAKTLVSDSKDTLQHTARDGC
jgi:hypothetical protein